MLAPLHPGYLNKRELLVLHWTPALIEAVLKHPDKIEHHKHGLKHWIEHLYSKERVEVAAQDSRFLAASAKRKKRDQKEKAEAAAVEARDWRELLPDAAALMKQLNRYAKHRVCNPVLQTEIYALKNEFIAALYRREYCTAAWIHRQRFPQQSCRECGGSGVDCDHCDGTGIWREERIFELWCFRFLIAGVTYTWHQPRSSVGFNPVEHVPPQDFEGFIGEKPVALPRRKFARAMKLIRLVADRMLFEETPAADAASIDDAAIPFERASATTQPPREALQESLFPF